MPWQAPSRDDPSETRPSNPDPTPNYRIIILDDDVNTFQHVVDCLVTFLPGLTRDHAWAMARQVDGEGSAVVWTGPQEQAELYHMQLGSHGLTMAPLEPV